MADSKDSSGALEPVAVTARPELVGRVLSDRYRVDALVARGAYGAVYRGVHLHMRKDVAIKVLHPEIENFPELVERFEREAVAGAHVTHPNVAIASDLGKFDGDSYFLVMEYIRGETLRATMAAERLSPARAARIVRQVADALSAAHARGIVHRDLKPSNIMLVAGTEDLVKLIDFGFARVPSEMPSIAHGLDELDPTTQPDMVFGHAAYLAPEAALGMQNVTPQYDLYALGLILYEALAGRHPFDTELSAAELFAHHRGTPPPTFAEIDPSHDVPEALEAVVRKLLEKDPADRFGSASELIEALDEAMGEDLVYCAYARPVSLHPPPRPSGEWALPPARPSTLRVEGIPSPPKRSRARRWWPLAAGVIVVGGATAFWLESREPAPVAPAPASTAEPEPSAAPSARPSASDPAARLAKHKRDLVALAPSGDTAQASAALLRLVKLDARALEDAAARDAAVTLLARLPAEDDATDAIFYQLAYHAGAAGLDVLYGVWERFPSSDAARRAETILDRQAWAAHASPALRITWEMRKTACPDLPPLFDRAGAEGDTRTRALLVSMSLPTCKAKVGQCCFPDDPALQRAIARLDEQ